MMPVFRNSGIEIYMEEEDDSHSDSEINDQKLLMDHQLRLIKQAEEGYDNSIMTAPVADPDENIGDTFMLPSTRENIETLLAWLTDDSIKVIAIQGKKGMGKTWTARHLMQRAVADKLFEFCIWVDSEFSEEATVQVAEQLGFPITHSYTFEQTIKKSIHSVLCDMHFLLIYDSFPHFVGTPEGLECTKASKCIVVREREGETRKGLYADKVLEIQKLSEDEAWLWFEKISGSKLIQEIDLIDARRLVQPFLDNCHGVPFKIAKLSRTAEIWSRHPSKKI